jgi:hypothetical protein
MKTSPCEIQVTVTVKPFDSPINNEAVDDQQGSTAPDEKIVKSFVKIARWCYSRLPWIAG